MRRIHILYEHGVDRLSYCSGHIRLLRPFAHPSVRGRVEVTTGQDLDGVRADVVIVERLWRPEIDLASARHLIERVRRMGAHLVYAQDDNILDLPDHLSRPWMRQEHIEVMELLQREAAGILVSTEPLRQRLLGYNANIVVLPNCLDEQLLVQVPRAGADHRKLTIGYMGTRNHDRDLAMIGPALAAAHARFGARLEIQIIGVLAREDDVELPVRIVRTPAGEEDYPAFMLWFTRSVRWDVAIAPVEEDAYSRCKSDIKLLDYAAIGAAGLFSRITPYASVRHRQTGYLVDNTVQAWTAGLMELLEDDALRDTIRRGARRYLFEDRTLLRRAVDWPAAIERLLERAPRLASRAA